MSEPIKHVSCVHCRAGREHNVHKLLCTVCGIETTGLLAEMCVDCEYASGQTRPGDCGHGEQVDSPTVVYGGSHSGGKTQAMGAVRLQFRNAGKPVFSVYPDNRIELHNDTRLDEASHWFWEAVKRAAPVQYSQDPRTRSVKVNVPVEPGDFVTRDMIDDTPCDYPVGDCVLFHNNKTLATVEVVTGYMLLIDETPVARLLINGVDIGIILPANGGIHKTIEKALKREPSG